VPSCSIYQNSFWRPNIKLELSQNGQVKHRYSLSSVQICVFIVQCTGSVCIYCPLVQCTQYRISVFLHCVNCTQCTYTVQVCTLLTFVSTNSTLAPSYAISVPNVPTGCVYIAVRFEGFRIHKLQTGFYLYLCGKLCLEHCKYLLMGHRCNDDFYNENILNIIFLFPQSTYRIYKYWMK